MFTDFDVLIHTNKMGNEALKSIENPERGKYIQDILRDSQWKVRLQ